MYKEVRGAGAMGFLATKPTMIITTRHESGIVNAGVFGAYTNLSGDQVGVAIGTSSDTYHNIMATKEFVINVPGAELVKKIRILAEHFPADKSELDAAGLTAKAGVSIETPSIAECAAAAEFAFDKEVPIGHHNFVIGKAQGGWIKEAVLDTDGKIDIFKARVFKDFKYPRAIYVLCGEVIEG